MIGLYIINKRGEPEPCDDSNAWARWFDAAPRHIEDTRLPNGTRISTVFLGVDHNFSGRGPPVLWETMVFGPKGDEEWCERYSSEQDAIEGHGRAVAWAKERMRT